MASRGGLHIFAADAFALLGLRALYFLVSGLLDRLVYLSTGLSLILLFIGVKLVLHFLHEQDDSIPEVSIGLSFAVIVAILAVATIASLIMARRDPSRRLAARQPVSGGRGAVTLRPGASLHRAPASRRRDALVAPSLFAL